MNEADNFLGIQETQHVICEEIDCYNKFASFFYNNDCKHLSIFHLNIRSYSKNIDSLFILLETLGTKFDIIILSEAWLDDK